MGLTAVKDKITVYVVFYVNRAHRGVCLSKLIPLTYEDVAFLRSFVP